MQAKDSVDGCSENIPENGGSWKGRSRMTGDDGKKPSITAILVDGKCMRIRRHGLRIINYAFEYNNDKTYQCNCVQTPI